MSTSTIDHIQWVRVNADKAPVDDSDPPAVIEPVRPHPKALPNRPKPFKVIV